MGEGQEELGLHGGCSWHGVGLLQGLGAGHLRIIDIGHCHPYIRSTAEAGGTWQ